MNPEENQVPRRLIRWASRYVGNRGVVLFTLGFMWSIYGLGLLLDHGGRQLDLPEEWFPYWLRGLWWLLPGVYAMLCAVIRKGQEDATAWGLLMLPIFIRWGSVVVAWIMDLTNSGKWQDFQRPWASFAIFLAFLVMIDRNAAGLDRLPPPKPAKRKKRGRK